MRVETKPVIPSMRQQVRPFLQALTRAEPTDGSEIANDQPMDVQRMG